MTLFLLVTGAVSCSLATDTTTPPPDTAALNVLFIGNSLTAWNDLPGMVHALIDSADAGPATVRSVAPANVGLEDHWGFSDAREIIALGGWDVVVLQQGPSATEGRPSLLEFSARFATEVRAVGAQVALYMVWPSTARLQDVDGVSDSYRTAALNVGGLLFPVGEAWRLAWADDPTLALYDEDGFHPSPAGSYLAALVMFEQLTGRSPVGAARALRTRSGTSVSFDAETASVLQAAAREANRRFALGASGTTTAR